MDSLTHLVAGALTPLAFRHTPKRAAVVAFGITVGELPDIDVLFGGSPEALLTLHRGVTHALLGQPLFVLFAVIPFYFWLKTRPPRLHALPDGGGAAAGSGPGPGSLPFGRMWFMAVFATCTHVYLDCMTTFGTQALLPFTSARVALPAMFIVDLILTVPILVLLVLALRQKADIVPAGALKAYVGVAVYSAKARRLARIGLVWVLLYPLLALGVNKAATAYYEPTLLSETAALWESAENAAPRFGGKALLMTDPFSPFVWKAIVDEGRSWRMATVNMLSSGERRYLPFAKPEPLLYETLSEQHPLFGHFENFAPLMAQAERPASAEVLAEYAEPVTEYIFADLRYIAAPESFTHKVGRGDPMFVLEARVNESGKLLAYRFLQRSVELDTPWTAVD